MFSKKCRGIDIPCLNIIIHYDNIYIIHNVSIVRKLYIYMYYVFIFLNKIFFYPIEITKFVLNNLGTVFSIILNIINGIFKMFKSVLEVKGTGFFLRIYDGNMVFNLGYSKYIMIKIPIIIVCNLLSSSRFELLCYDNQVLGSFCNKIILLRKVNIYTLKGVIDISHPIRQKKINKKK